MIQDLNKYIESAKMGKSYEEIKEDAIIDGIEKEELKELMRKIDDIVLKNQLKESYDKQAKESIFVGIIFILISLFSLQYLYFDSSSHYFYIGIAGIFGGFIIISKGILQLKK